MRPILGIDVGWSRTRRSCGLAVRGAGLKMPRGSSKLKNGVSVGRGSLDEVAGAVGAWARACRDERDVALIVVDGPVAQGSPPAADRGVDAACGVDWFYGRAQPVRISHPKTFEYLEATYRIIDALGPRSRAAVWTGGQLPSDRLVIVETNPTVALALLVPQQLVKTLPSRKRAQMLPSGRAIRAKSDWYWAIGGSHHVARAIGAPEVASEFDHERVAALLCLGVGVQLASEAADRTAAIAIGDAAGIYVVPAAVDESWTADLIRVGVVFGTAVGTRIPADDRTLRSAQLVAIRSEPVEPRAKMSSTEPSESDNDDIDRDRGDEVDMLLCDDGGVWERHNDWLTGEAAPLRIETLHGSHSMVLTHAAQHDRSGQWKSKPTTRTIARTLGLSKARLSTKTCCSVRVRIKA